MTLLNILMIILGVVSIGKMSNYEVWWILSRLKMKAHLKTFYSPFTVLDWSLTAFSNLFLDFMMYILYIIITIANIWANLLHVPPKSYVHSYNNDKCTNTNIFH